MSFKVCPCEFDRVLNIDVSNMEKWLRQLGNTPEILELKKRFSYACEALKEYRDEFREKVQEIFSDWEGEKFNPERHVLALEYVHGAWQMEKLVLDHYARRASDRFESSKTATEDQSVDDQLLADLKEFCEIIEHYDYL